LHGIPEEVQERAELVTAGLLVHMGIEKMAGAHHHSLGLAIQGARQDEFLAPASARAARQVQRAGSGARHQAWGGEGKGFVGKFVDVGMVSGEDTAKGIHVFEGVEQGSEDGKVSGGDSACEENGFLHGKVSGECKEEGTHGWKVGDGKVSGDSGGEEKYKHGKLANFGKDSGEGKGKGFHGLFAGFGKVYGECKEKKGIHGMLAGNGKVSGHDSIGEENGEENGIHGQAVDGGVSGERTERSVYGDPGCEENGVHGKLVDKVSGEFKEKKDIHGLIVGNGKVSGLASGCEEKGIHGQPEEGGVSGEMTESCIHGDPGCKEKGIHGKLVDVGKVSGEGEMTALIWARRPPRMSSPSCRRGEFALPCRRHGR